ncbi:MAG: phosphoribosylanthranilate isomerase, partial [Hyphomonadaceae bacterium]|nr:phosphoribosylanthranilate isomerase [Hyphomonadaceae bacterium]
GPAPPKVKICGLTRTGDVEVAVHFGADYVGFVVEAESQRRLGVDEAARISRPARGMASIVAVTVNAGDALISSIFDRIQPDYIQLHGDESPDRVRFVSRNFGAKTIKAIAVNTRAHVEAARAFEDVTDIIVFDARPPKPDRNTDAKGGHGLSFDWDIVECNEMRQTWALAGGLTPENVTEAVHRTSAPILDVSSGVEYEPGKKDPAKIRRFITQAKQQKLDPAI